MEEEKMIACDLVKVDVIAKLFGVSIRRVQQLTQEGIIKTEKTINDNRVVRRYDVEDTVVRYVKYLSDKAYGRNETTDKELKLKHQKLQADIALKESQGELHRIKTEIAAGKYISREEVKMDYSKFFVVFKKFAMSLPSRISSRVSGVLEPVEARQIEKDLVSDINQLLTSFVLAGVTEDDEK